MAKSVTVNLHQYLKKEIEIEKNKIIPLLQIELKKSKKEKEIAILRKMLDTHNYRVKSIRFEIETLKANNKNIEMTVNTSRKKK